MGEIQGKVNLTRLIEPITIIVAGIVQYWSDVDVRRLKRTVDSGEALIKWVNELKKPLAKRKTVGLIKKRQASDSYCWEKIYHYIEQFQERESRV